MDWSYILWGDWPGEWSLMGLIGVFLTGWWIGRWLDWLTNSGVSTKERRTDGCH